MNQFAGDKASDAPWQVLYSVGGVAALAAGVLFRRNIAAELELLVERPSPVSVGDWFALLQSQRLLGLAYLNVFDLVNYVLVGVMFLALYVLLGRVCRSEMAIATMLVLIGVTVYVASNTSLSMLSLSDQYVAATTDAQRTRLLAAGEALLAMSRFTNPSAAPGTGGYVSLLFIAIASMMASRAMLRSGAFNRATGYVGLLAGALDVGYCVAFATVPQVDGGHLALVFIPAAGLFWMVWHMMVGWRLYQLGRRLASIGETP